MVKLNIYQQQNNKLIYFIQVKLVQVNIFEYIAVV